MAKVTKIGDKLAKVSDNFTVSRYDNGFLVEISGRDKEDDWATAKIVADSEAGLAALVKEATTLPLD